MHPVRGPVDPVVVAATLSLAALVWLAWRWRRSGGLAPFGVVWFVVLLLPSVALAAVDGSDSLAEHRVYLPSIGFFLVVGSFVGWSGARLGRVSGRLRILAATAFAVVLLSLAGRTALRNLVWSDPVTLWSEAVQAAPENWFPRSVLGEVLNDAGRHAEAAQAFQSALALNPQNETDYFNLALCLALSNRADAAAATLEALRRLDPQSDLVPVGLGAVAMSSGDPARARADFLEVLGRDPTNLLALQSLALLEEREEHFAEAIRRCEEIQRLAPQSAAPADCIRRNRLRLTGAGP